MTYLIGMAATNLSLVTLFEEIFQGTPPGADGTWFVQGDEALDVTLDSLTFEEASTAPTAQANSIAAHVIHMTYYLELANDGLRGRERQGDWPGSWMVQTVDAQRWVAVKEALRHQRESMRSILAEHSFENAEDLTHAIANIAHAAYHLGAIRQLYLIAKS